MNGEDIRQDGAEIGGAGASSIPQIISTTSKPSEKNC